MKGMKNILKKSAAKRYIMEYNTFIQANIGTIVPSLRDHGAHAAFCDKLNDLRNKFLDIDSGNR